MKWIKSKFPGVRYREHPTRKHGVTPDRYYTIFYKRDGKMIQEALGWASNSWEETDKNGQKTLVNWTEKRAAAVQSELQKNQNTGDGPSTLKEKRAVQQREVAIQKAEGITVEEFWESDYLTHLQGRLKSWNKEVEHFERRIRPHIGGKALKTVTHEDVERLVDKMRADGLAPRTQEYAVGTMSRIWSHAAKRKIVKPGDNPAKGIAIARVNNTRLRVLTPEELRLLLEYLSATDQNAHDITLFCAFTGCRFSEAANLRWEYVDFQRQTAMFAETKNKESREVFLDSKITDMLRRRGPAITAKYVFQNKKGHKYLEPPKSFKTATENLGFNKDRGPRDRVSFHNLRHTCATFANRNGMTMKDMQQVFGWKTPHMVFRYAKGDKIAQQQAMRAIAISLTEPDEKIIPLTGTDGNKNIS